MHLHCPNLSCQATNPESNKFCQKCRTPLPKRYLRAIGAGSDRLSHGDVIADRYLVKGDRILLDLKPGHLPALPERVSQELEPYLRLFPYRLHVPQFYGLLPQQDSVGLLEQAPIDPDTVRLYPKLAEVWKDVSPMRQLNWLWQIARLWQPFKTEAVASSLLDLELLRAEGAIVRLLELSHDYKVPKLRDLGHLWLQWAEAAHPAIAAFIQRICQQLIEGNIHTAEQLIVRLDRGLAICGRSQVRQVEIVAQTDRGPSRSRNEDACYPDSATPQTTTDTGIAIVCDGIGGHEGGDVASGLAIETIVQHLQHQSANSNDLTPGMLIPMLEDATFEANAVIGDRNNDERRQGRQRMGTTLVMALVRASEMYIAHVGDSRVYWIRREGCYQVTLDDDVASREVRLGYAPYREALQQVASGSLVQALGMGPSTTLHPTVGRLILDEDSVFLLCSDGLSDRDRVEQYWDTEIRPLLDNHTDLAAAVQKLIQIANTENGHDNVTVGLVRVRVRNRHNWNRVAAQLRQQLEAVALPTQTTSGSTDLPVASQPTGEGSTQILTAPSRTATRPFPFFLAGLATAIVLAAGGGLAYWWLELRSPSVSVSQREPISQPPPTETPAPDPTVPPTFDPSRFVRIDLGQQNVLQLLEDPESAQVRGNAPSGSLLKVIQQQIAEDGTVWLQLRLCSIPNPEVEVNGEARSPQVRDLQLQPGETGWVREDNMTEVASTNLQIPRTLLGACQRSEETPVESLPDSN